MKKKALRKDFYIEIKRSLGRFLSIFFIVALGVSFFAGIRASEPDMRLSGDEYFDEHHLADMKVISTMGLTAEDVEALGKTEGIKDVEYGYSTDMMCNIDGVKKVVHVMTEPETMNQAEVEEGRLPGKEGECFADIDFLQESGYKVGDEIVLESGSDTPVTDTLTGDTYTIVGAGSSPCYISFERGSSTIGTGEVSGFLIVAPESFSMDVYTEVYMTVDGAFDETAFTEAYDSKIAAAKEQVEGIKDARQEARHEEIVTEAEGKLSDAEKELSDGRQKLEEAKKEFEDGKTELSDGRRELEEAKKKISDGRKELSEGEKALADAGREAEAELKNASDRLKTGEKELEAGKKELSAGKKALASAKSVLDEKQKELNAAKKQYEEGLAGLENGKAELAKQEEAFNRQSEEARAGIAQLEEGIREAESGLAQLEIQAEAAKAEVSGKELAYAEAEKKYEEALGGLETGAVTEEEVQALKTQMHMLEQEKVQAEAVLSALRAGCEEVSGKLSELENQLAAIKNQLQDGREAIEAARAQLVSGEEELNRAKAQIESGQKQIESGYSEINTNEKKLSSAESAIISSEKEIAAGWKSYQSGKEEAERQLADGEKKLADSRKQLEDADREVAGNEKKLEDGERELSDGEKEIQDAETELLDGEKEIADAKKEIEEIAVPKWYVYDRDVFEQYSGYGENADRMRAIGEVFPVLFFLVAALISLTTMTRMVEEQRTQIGTLKALGYGKFSIAGKYLGYALLATLGGSVVGVLAGEKLYPYIIVTAYKIMYPHLPNVVIPYHMSYALMATGAAVVCTMAATVFSCYKEMASQPAVLMRPPSPKQGKRVFLERVTFIWKRLSFTWKSTIRNLIRYKKRFFMTIFGIGGCMALILVGYGLRDSIFNIAVIQYEDIQTYNMMAILDEDASEEEKEAFAEYADGEDEISDSMDVYMKNMTIGKGGEEQETYVYVPADEGQFEDFVKVRDRKTGEKYALSDEGAILTEKIAKTLSAEAGDTIYIKDEENRELEVKVTAVCENYMGHYLYLTKDLYESLFGEQPEYNAELFKLENTDEEKIQQTGEQMLATKAVINVQYMNNMQSRIEDMLVTLDSVIIVLIAAAGMLAFVVLYNLNNINITERRRELATLKVLGFFDLEVAEYVYRENILLTLTGALAGCGLGYLLHQFVIVTVEVDDVMFGRNIDWKSYAIAFLFTVGFSAFVNWVMYFKLRKINMVESLKSVE